MRAEDVMTRTVVTIVPSASYVKDPWDPQDPIASP